VLDSLNFSFQRILQSVQMPIEHSRM
jgi:hypothetical protein